MTQHHPFCLTHSRPVDDCAMSDDDGRCSVSARDYDVLIERHLAFHDALGTPADRIDGRCLYPMRECRCYWPERVEVP